MKNLVSLGNILFIIVLLGTVLRHRLRHHFFLHLVQDFTGILQWSVWVRDGYFLFVSYNLFLDIFLIYL